MLSVITASDWINLLTPIAVAVAIILQRMQAQQVKSSLSDAADKSNTKLDVIHGLVNGNLTEAMRVAVTQSQRIADLTKDPKDADAAAASIKAYGDHIAAVAQRPAPAPDPATQSTK